MRNGKKLTLPCLVIKSGKDNSSHLRGEWTVSEYPKGDTKFGEGDVQRKRGGYGLLLMMVFEFRLFEA